MSNRVTSTNPSGADGLVRARSVLAVVAHPDDESFDLGGVLDVLTDAGTTVHVLCFTHGEASTLRVGHDDLSTVRTLELADAAQVLGVEEPTLLDYPDGRLADTPVAELAGHVRASARQGGATHLLAFDVGGVTGHPDHRHATAAALYAGGILGLPVVGWAVPCAVADRLNRELGTSFVGRPSAHIDWTVTVDRSRQWKAINAHASQATHNPVLRRRLELLGDTEHLLRLDL